MDHRNNKNTDRFACASAAISAVMSLHSLLATRSRVVVLRIGRCIVLVANEKGDRVSRLGLLGEHCAAAAIPPPPPPPAPRALVIPEYFPFARGSLEKVSLVVASAVYNNVSRIYQFHSESGGIWECMGMHETTGYECKRLK